VYLDRADLPSSLEVVQWGWYARLFNLWGWLPFFTTFRRIECPSGKTKGVYATTTRARDAWLTPDSIQKLCALQSELSTTGFFRGRHYLEQRSDPASDSGDLVVQVMAVLDDARRFTQ
ncbi:MAG: hypothetical protein ACR2N2_04720, partial [Acidimicrobiia bacterium]